MMISRSPRAEASWEVTGRGPGTWPSELFEDAAAAGAGAGAGEDLRLASPCGSAPGRQSRGGDASSCSSHRSPYRLVREETVDNQRLNRLETTGLTLRNSSALRQYGELK